MSFLKDLLSMDLGKTTRCDRVSVRSSIDLVVHNGKCHLEPIDAVTDVAGKGIARTSGYVPRPYIDDLEATLGISIVKVDGKLVNKPTAKTALKHSEYIKFLKQEGHPDKGIDKLVSFIEGDVYANLTSKMDEDEMQRFNEMLMKGRSAVRMVILNHGTQTILAEKYADAYTEKCDAQAFCTLSGELGTQLPTRNKEFETIKRVRGGAATGIVLISCNTAAYRSAVNYNFEMNDGTPLTKESYAKALRNFQYLVDSKKNYVVLPNSDFTSYIIKYDGVPEPIQGVITSTVANVSQKEDLFNLGYDDEDIVLDEIKPKNDKKAAQPKYVPNIEKSIYDKFRAVKDGKYNSEKLTGTVTCYRIHCVQGRWSCNGEFSLDLESVCKNIETWYNDTMIAGRPQSPYGLLRSIIAPMDKVNWKDYDNLIHAILFGEPINRKILDKAVIRVRFSGKRATLKQLSIIKASYNNLARLNNQKELSNMLDKTNKSYAYNLGRLLAVGDYIQGKANATINTPVSGRLSNRACVTPVVCLKDLLARIQRYHEQCTKKVETRGAAIYAHKIMCEVLDNLKDTSKGRLTAEEEAELRIGLAQQTNDFYTKKTTTTEKEV